MRQMKKLINKALFRTRFGLLIAKAPNATDVLCNYPRIFGFDQLRSWSMVIVVRERTRLIIEYQLSEKFLFLQRCLLLSFVALFLCVRYCIKKGVCVSLFSSRITLLMPGKCHSCL